MNAPIGVIDSGVGGLTVVKEMLRYLPNEEIYYIGDTARCPYGPRTPKEVVKFTWQMANKLEEMGIKMLVIACNTATCVALESLQKYSKIPVIGVINAGAQAAIKATKTHDIAVIATAGTVKSAAYENAIASLYSSSNITSLACPPLVPLVESGEYHSDFALDLVKHTLQPLEKDKFDTLILGCTHYPIIKDLIQRAVGDDVHIVSSATETAKQALDILQFQGIERKSNEAPQHKFFATGSLPIFKDIATNWLPIDNVNAARITL